MSEKVYWELRYRSPISPTKGVDTVRLETNSTSEARAKEVAEHWLSTKMAHPSTRFVYVRRDVVQTEDDMVRELTKKPTTDADLDIEPKTDGQTKGKTARVGV